MSEQEPDESPRTPALRASDADRERVALVLHKSAAEGRITVAELEERLDVVYAAKTLDQLDAPVADLPRDGDAPFVLATSQPGQLDRIGGTPGSSTSVAVMSGTRRAGEWVLPAKHTSVAFWGGVQIDLRQARYAETESVITAVAVMGAVEILVPDDVIVEESGIGIMGDFSKHSKSGTRPEPRSNAPVVRVRGVAFWGAVSIVRVPQDEIRELAES